MKETRTLCDECEEVVEPLIVQEADSLEPQDGLWLHFTATQTQVPALHLSTTGANKQVAIDLCTHCALNHIKAWLRNLPTIGDHLDDMAHLVRKEH